jgi:hypothetical protein
MGFRNPKLFDCFMLLDELDMLECRLIELFNEVDRFVIVECGETHQGTPKPSHYLDNKERFRPWAEKIEHIWVHDLGATDPMQRDREQREWFKVGMAAVAVEPWDIVLQSDLDEIPAALFIKSSLEHELWTVADRSNFLAFEQRLHCFAVDWEYPIKWKGTVAARYAHIKSFADMRDARATAPFLKNAGHHISWLGGPEQAVRKLDAFAHTEIAYQRPNIAAGFNLERGIHVDGVKMAAVDVDDTWPQFVRSGRCPKNWFRPRAQR